MNLNFKSFGHGDPLIIIHGLFGTLDNSQTIPKQLADEYLVFIIDQRNHGRSPHTDEFNYPLLADDLRDFMEQNWIHRAHILGHSMGGKVAMQFALTYPDMVDKLIVADIAPKAYERGHDRIFEALIGVPLDTVTDRSTVERIISPYVHDYGTRLFLMKNLSRNTSGSFEWKMNLDSLYRHYPEILGDVAQDTEPFEGETLFIRGGKSEYIDPSEFDTIKERFPNAQLFTIEEAGHWVHADAPEAFLGVVQSYLGGTL